MLSLNLLINNHIISKILNYRKLNVDIWYKYYTIIIILNIEFSTNWRNESYKVMTLMQAILNVLTCDVNYRQSIIEVDGILSHISSKNLFGSYYFIK